MKNIKNTFMVTALSLGLVVGAVGVAGAATSTNYQKEIADWFENDPNPVVMHTNTVADPDVTPAVETKTDVTPAVETKTDVTPAVETKTHVTPAVETKTHVTPAAETRTHVTPAAETRTHVTPVAETKTHVTPVAVTKAPVTPPQTVYHYSDGHSNMNPEQHQQMHVTQPSGNHMSGGESGHESGHE